MLCVLDKKDKKLAMYKISLEIIWIISIPICLRKDIDLNLPCTALLAYFIVDTFNDKVLESRGINKNSNIIY